MGDELKMELNNPQASGMLITNIDGLGPGVANLRANEYSASHGGVFNSAKLPMREIVIDIEFLRTKHISAEDAMRATYKYFPIMKQVELTFKTHGRESMISGIVSANDSNLFFKNSGTQITILCPQPFFRSVNTDVTMFYGQEPKFEFEFSNEEGTKELLMGEIQQEPERLINYSGDSEVGFVISMRAYGTVVNPAFYDLNDRTFMKIDSNRIIKKTGKGIGDGDEIIINSIHGEKSVILRRDGIDTKILSAMTRDSTWLTLGKGDNHYAYIADQGFGVMNVVIKSYVLFEGL